MREQSAILVKTGFLPEAIRTPEQAVAIMLKARELGIPPMYGLSNIAIIKGKPVANAELMLALIYRDHGDNAIRFKTSDNKQCTVAYRRRSWTQPETYSFTLDDAKQAGLLGNQTWSKYPQAMLRARCISAVARMAFADTIGGLYTPEELGATVAVSDEGEIVTVNEPPPTEPLRLVSPPTPMVLTQDTSAERKRLWGVLNDTMLEGKALGINITVWDQMIMDGNATNEQIVSACRKLRNRINTRKEEITNPGGTSEDEQGSFTEDDAELFPAGRPA
jgi:hypothetical protein